MKDGTPLTKAVSANDIEVVNLLYDLEADMNQCDHSGMSPLTLAVKNKNVEMISLLHTLDADINKPDAEGLTPLTKAVSANDIEMVNRLYELEADMDQCDHNEISPLTLAVKNKNVEMISLLHTLGADINKPDVEGWTPLTMTVSANDIELVKLLYDLEADIDQCDGEGWTPLTNAIEYENIETVVLLNKLKANMNKIDGKGFTPMIMAVIKNSPSIINLLHQMGSDINGICGNGWTPLTKALADCNLSIYKLLKEIGADNNTEIIDRKFLAHVWGMGGFSEFLNKSSGKESKIPNEGLTVKYSMEKSAQYLSDFFEDSEYKKIPVEKKSQIIEAMANGFPLLESAPKAMIERLKKGKPLLINTGSFDHTISLVLFENQLVICNRGMGYTDYPIEFYSLPVKNITEILLEKLTATYINMDTFNQMIKDLKLNFIRGQHLKPQKVGNCTWANTKAAFAVLCHYFFGHKNGRELYKEFTEYTRKRCLYDYCQKSNSPDKTFLEELLKKIEKKIKTKEGLKISKTVLVEFMRKTGLG